MSGGRSAHARRRFFFSSRRRHTRWNCDWSSDVCSSDLTLSVTFLVPVFGLIWGALFLHERPSLSWLVGLSIILFSMWCVSARRSSEQRSEERRVGKECRARWSAYH